jgi:hypothetical protein
MLDFRFEVHPTQMEVLNDKHRFKTLVCGRRWGKDHLISINLLIESFSKISPRGQKLYAWLNPVYNPQGKESFRIFRQFAESGKLIAKDGVIRTPPMEVTLINGDRITFFSADQPDNLRSGQYDGIIINEAGLMNSLMELWEGPIAAMLIDRQGWAWLSGTPKGKNAFHKMYLRGLSDQTSGGKVNMWKSFRYSTYDNPYIPVEELDRLKLELPEDMFSQEFLAEFLDTGGMVFKGLSHMRMRSQDHKLKPQAANCRIGIDIGRHSDWTVLVALNENNCVVGFERFKDLPWSTLLMRIKNFLTKFRGKMVMDIAGPGEVLYEALQGQGIPMTGVKFNNERKAFMTQNVASLIESGALHIPPPVHGVEAHVDLTFLWTELEAFTYDILPTGKVRYSAPMGMFDDCVTALMLAASELPPMVVPEDGLYTKGLDARMNDVREPGETYDAYDDSSSEELADDPLA